MNGTKTIIVDYSGVRYARELHLRLRDAMNWPDWYGCNLSALWDIFFCEGYPKKIIFRGMNDVYKNKDMAEFWEEMRAVLDDMVIEIRDVDHDDFSYELQP